LRDSNQIEILIEACKRNDQKAQLEIYNRYCKAMYNTAYRIVNDFHDAEDVMQEAFIKAFSKLNSFKGDATFGSWLKKIVINESIYWVRKNNKYKMVSLESVKEVENDDVSTEMNINTPEIKTVLETISKLKDNYRVALTLYLIEGYDYEEIQKIMDISYANIRTLVSRAKNKLKQNLKEHYEFAG